MAHMLFALGRIIHLNQDLSQPDHVRNDEHLIPWHRWIENFGVEIYFHEPNAFPLEPRGWPSWQSNGFSKILDFWDRGHYAGNASALDAEANGGEKLGLAEFCNGNFLGEDATYAEFFSPGSLHYFPLPSLTNTTQPQINPNNLAGTIIDTVSLANHKQGDRVYISKTSAGTNIVHHSALHYFAVLHPPKIESPPMAVALTINDTNVLQEYHAILIPKAIEYSAGILDYFFRGSLAISTPSYTCGADAPTYSMQVTNTSSQDLQGGSFHIFYDDDSSNRTELDITTTYTGALPTNGSITVTFTAPDDETTNYILAYQGTIGATNSVPLDPVDADIGVIVATVPCPSGYSGPTWQLVIVQYVGGNGNYPYPLPMPDVSNAAYPYAPIPPDAQGSSMGYAFDTNGVTVSTGVTYYALCVIDSQHWNDDFWGNGVSSLFLDSGGWCYDDVCGLGAASWAMKLKIWGPFAGTVCTMLNNPSGNDDGNYDCLGAPASSVYIQLAQGQSYEVLANSEGNPNCGGPCSGSY